ncbi:MAG: thiolase family protein [Gammaproteobacteria bacterium]|nr:thiolase family protein [Gammaproteobacteria bacterium]
MPRPGEAIEEFEQDILCDLIIQTANNSGVAREDIGSLNLTSPTPATQQLGFATFLASRLGLRCDARISDINNMGITGGLAFDQACEDVSSGKTDFALACGIEFSTGAPAEMIMDRGIRVVGDVDFQSPFGLTPIAWYAFDANRYMHETGASRNDIAQIAVKNRAHAALNPLAQYRKPMTLEEVCAQRPIVEPLGLFEVSPVGDGAICLMVSSEENARSLNKPYVRVRGRGFQHDGHHQIGNHYHDMLAFPAASHTGNVALTMAGVKIDDINLAELYAPCTITELLVSEALGLAEKGKGYMAVLDGEYSLGGRLPISTSGGCLSRGHPPGLTGLYGLAELYDQLTAQAGERQVRDATLALHICEGGNYNLALAHVLESMQ